MIRLILLMGLVVSLVASSTGAAAQDAATPVPVATVELAAVGEPGPPMEVARERRSTEEFVRVVVQDANVMWAGFFEMNGMSFVPPTVMLVDDGHWARSSCGISAGNPADNNRLNPAFYCIYGGETGMQVEGASVIFPTQYIYSPIMYFSTAWLEEHFSANAMAMDIAIAYMVSHVYAHHIQYQLGYIDHTGGGCCDIPDVEIELSADCLAGVWAFSSYDRGYLTEADIREAQAASWGPGADRSPEFGREGVHGTPDEQLQAFMTGYSGGEPAACFPS